MNNDFVFFENGGDFVFEPQKFMSYEKMVKLAIKDTRPFRPMLMTAMVMYKSDIAGRVTIFKIDGAKIRKKLSDRYVMISPITLEAYGKTPEEFLEDWNKAHKH